ncbi:7-carboxy-7-deazaguanine synthase QueE [Methanolobus halotolerans]|uniref:7-carboxy-7-deazaguanine synthase n=1 Tax=Methanolobus halotolerans TaxID=2052935 RepID=A0A4E0Q2I0_9EURY|nr:7-carboxy-7-deazaguanine synthase QueE [Methanolobus halotolerans]TGC07005.1 7-carboxy-7-deazaguanine synthase QueE [Methanolobus halotolerans]
MYAPVSEIFCSVQGEGPYVGSRQAFVRFSGCNLSCSYCDTPTGSPGMSRFEEKSGSGSFSYLENPLSGDAVERMVASFGNIHSVSLTGGEPLLHAEFISGLNISKPLYLESNMTLPHMAKKVRDKLSYVSGDVKMIPPSSVEDFDDHIERTIECFRVLKNTKNRDCFCKIVITKDTDADDIEGVVGAISGYISCLVLQPVSQAESLPKQGYLLDLQEKLLDNVDTKIIPQTHRMWGCL